MSINGVEISDGRLAARSDRYEFGPEIARGGMGCVFRATDRRLERLVAVKVLLADPESHADAARRFVDEARITGMLEHPGVPPVHDLGSLADGRPYLAMKLIHGRTLAALLAERRHPQDDLPTLLRIFEQICQTVAFAHSKAVGHRDLKPANVMVGAFGEVQVMDWGLAKQRSGTTATVALLGETPARLPETNRLDATLSFHFGLHAATQAGSILGTVSYMPPEQARGQSTRSTPGPTRSRWAACYARS